MRMVRRYLYLKPNEEINTMSRIVTQSKLNELTGKNIDYGKGGGIVRPIRRYFYIISSAII